MPAPKGGNTGSFKPGNRMGKGAPKLPDEIKEMRKSGRDVLFRIITECEGMTRDQLDKALQKPKLTILEEYIINGYLRNDKDIIRECQQRVYGKPSDSNKVFDDEAKDTSPSITIITKSDFDIKEDI